MIRMCCTLQHFTAQPSLFVTGRCGSKQAFKHLSVNCSVVRNMIYCWVNSKSLRKRRDLLSFVDDAATTADGVTAGDK